ncbi:VrrA/YqfQ family protein [Virgibacillus salinus]|uniref:YqfQ-like protein n=1 Tax=Virgibacillus salinus TaxID=553311 RepID=A0A1H1BVQ0_9BACI|nr:VrrA/YqfQ family protein [Virgibacillus salinus]SDQ55971.1 YqfQ-like protein [Virgibacillus salinus]
MVWPIQPQNPSNHILQNRGGFQGVPQEPHLQDLMHRFLPPQYAQNLLSPNRIGGLTQTLNNIQKVLKVVQSTAPIVQQYAPIAKNLPTMFKLMKALNEDDDTESESEEQTSRIESKNDHKHSTNNQNTSKRDVGKSTPKLYI